MTLKNPTKEKVCRYMPFISRIMSGYTYLKKPPEKDTLARVIWDACRTALTQFSSYERKIIVDVYRKRDTLGDNVYTVAREYNKSQDKIWSLIERFTREFLKEWN